MDKFQDAKLFFEKGIKAYLSKDMELSESFFLKTLEYAPESIPTLENLSRIYMSKKNYGSAEKFLKIIVSLEKPGNEIGFKLLYELYAKQNRYWDIKYLIKEATEKNKFNDYQIIEAKLFYPNFFASNEELVNIRKDFSNEIDNLENKNLIKLDLKSKLLKPTNYELSYDGYDNLDINKKLNKIYKKIYPEVNNYKVETFQKNEKIKIGFISEFFTDHTIMKLFKGFIYKLNKEIFDVFVLHSNQTRPGTLFNEINESIVLHGHKNIILPKEFHKKLDSIQELGLDIIFYPDIHMSTNLYYLTLYRLAKHQITSWGHPETTGNNEIDYFLSSKLLETNGYEERYSEKVLLSNYLPMYFYEPKVLNKLKNEELNIKNHYSCPQSLFKMHPSFDEVIRKILTKDKKAKITFIKDREEILSKMFYERLNKIIPGEIDRVIFIDRLTPKEFINHCGRSSVLLDPFWFGAGNTFHESMYYGTPTVTKPTSYLKSRIVSGAYKQMEINNAPVFNNIDEYVEQCIDFANNDILDLKMHYKDQAYKNLFENENAIKDIEKIFKNLMN